MGANRQPTHLYHYTTAHGLQGIIKDQEIWASDIFYLNDWKEFYHGRDGLINQINEYLSTAEGPTRRALQRVVKALKRLDPMNCPHAFVCSFSATAGGDDLSQWRAYCPTGGYAIGFPYKKLDHVGFIAGFQLAKCRYDKDHYPLEILKRIEALCKAAPPGSWGLGIALLCHMVGTCKDPSFAGEEEWRFISTRPFRVEPRFRVHGNLLIPYMAIKLAHEDLWKDIDIIVGPSSREYQQLRLESVKMLLEAEVQKGNLPPIGTKNVRLSKIPYRALVGG